MLPARHLAAIQKTPDVGECEVEIVHMAQKLEASWNQMLPRIDANKKARGELPEKLTDEEKEHIADSEQSVKELDSELEVLTQNAESALDIIELMLPLYEDEVRFWKEVTKNPKNIHPEDKVIVDEILEQQQLLIQRLQEYCERAG